MDEEYAETLADNYTKYVENLIDLASGSPHVYTALNPVFSKIDERKYATAEEFWEDMKKKVGSLKDDEDDGRAKILLTSLRQFESAFWTRESVEILNCLDVDDRAFYP